MIRTLIIDDEPRNIKLIAKIIGGHCPSLEIVGTTDNLTEVLPMVKNLQPALLLLDIEFPDNPGRYLCRLQKASCLLMNPTLYVAKPAAGTPLFTSKKKN